MNPFLNFHNLIQSLYVPYDYIVVSLRSQALFAVYVSSDYKSTLRDQSMACTNYTVTHL